MNERYERYIEYIADELEPPYFINMRDSYGLSPDEYEMVLSKIFKQPVSIKDSYVYDNQENIIYAEDSNGFWEKSEYNDQGNLIYFETSYGYIMDRR